MNERIQALLKAAQDDEGLRASLAGASSVAEFVAAAAAAGYEVTADDLEEMPALDASDAELEGAGAMRTMPVCSQTCPGPQNTCDPRCPVA